MTKSELFKKAHALTKAIIKAGDDYRITFGLAIKAILADSKNIVDTLLALGLKIWENYGKKRIYMTVAQFNQATNSKSILNSRYTTYFYDFKAKAIYMVYKKNRPSLEIQY
ncbi:hypothetical protein ACFBZI_07740 [Moraxella sp. ZJ142]|uniref:hypothetical protein n=1 Tax=Moraxella marmotae TaxID=3344520 RepID=UPI0035D4169B